MVKYVIACHTYIDIILYCVWCFLHYTVGAELSSIMIRLDKIRLYIVISLYYRCMDDYGELLILLPPLLVIYASLLDTQINTFSFKVNIEYGVTSSWMSTYLRM